MLGFWVFPVWWLKTHLPLPRTRVQSLVVELRSHVLLGN